MRVTRAIWDSMQMKHFKTVVAIAGVGLWTTLGPASAAAHTTLPTLTCNAVGAQGAWVLASLLALLAALRGVPKAPVPVPIPVRPNQAPTNARRPRRR